MAKKAENKNQITALYCRLSVEDMKDDDKAKGKRRNKEDESNSITNHDVMYRGWITPKNITS